MNQQKKIETFSLIFLLSTLLLSLVYIYNSGVPQPAHYLAIISSLILIYINHERVFYLLKNNKFGIYFLIYCTIINLCYSFYYQNNIFNVSTLHWIYGFTVLITILTFRCRDSLFLWSKIIIFIGLLLIFILYLSGFGGYIFWPRYQFFLNGPNQLGFYLLCIGIIYLVVTKAKIDSYFFIVFGLLVFCALSTGGRSVYIGLLALVFFYFYIARYSLKNIIMLTLICSSIMLIYFYSSLPVCGNPYLIKNKSDNKFSSCLYTKNINTENDFYLSSLKRFDISASSVDSKYSGILYQLDVRGYLRLMEYPQFLLFGAGQGFDERFDNKYGYEIHSSIASVVFYYGIIGAILFIIFIWKLFFIKENLILLLPIFLYGLFTNGIRSPYFWAALGFAILSPQNFFKK